MPKHFQVEERADEVVIIHRWQWGAGVVMLGVGVFVGGFFGTSNSSLFEITESFFSIDTLFTIAQPTAALGFIYLGLAYLLNKTTIRIRADHLSIRHAPLLWPGNKQLNPAHLSQLYSEKYASHRQNDTTQYRYQVCAKTIDGREIKLLRGLEESEQARFIEQQLKKHLAIKDRPVQGELPT